MATYTNVELLMSHGTDGVHIAALPADGKATVWTITEAGGVVKWKSGVEIEPHKWLVLTSPSCLKAETP